MPVASAPNLPAQRRVLRWLTGGALGLVLGSSFGFLWHERGQAVDSAQVLAERRVGRLAGDLQQALALARVAIAQAESRLARLPPGAPLAGMLGESPTERAELLAVLPLPFELHALDAEGHEMDLVPRRHLGGSAGEHTHHHAAPGPLGDGWFIGDTQGAPGSRFVPMLRRAAPNPHGAVAYAADFSHAALVGLFDASRMPSGGGVALFRVEPAGGEVSLLARAPFIEAELGQRVRGPLVQALQRAPQGVFEAVTPLDGIRRVVAYRRLQGEADALVLVYGMEHSAVLATWWAKLPFATVATMLLAGMVLLGARRLDRSLREVDAGRREAEISQARLNYLLTNSPAVIYTARFDGDFSTTYYSPNLVDLLGWTAKHFADKPSFWLDHVHPDDRADVLARLGAIGQGDNLVLEYRFQHRDGRWRWMRDHLRLSRSSAAAPLELIGSWIDVTERREAEDEARRLNAELEQRVRERTAQLEASERRYRTIFETVPVAIGEQDWSGVQRLLRDLRGRGISDGPAYLAAHPDFVEQCLRAVIVRRVNQKALSLQDACSQPEDLPDLRAIYTSPDTLPQFIGEIEAMWAGQHLYTARKSLPSVTGRPLSLMLTMSMPGIDDDDGTALVCLVDISEVDRLSGELDASLARLRQAHRELETFTYSVSHDLKAPLRGIDGYSRLLLSDHAASLDDEGRRFLDHIRQATRQMAQLIDDLLAYSRLERRELALGDLPLHEVVEGVLAGCREEVRLLGAQVRVDVPASLRTRGDGQGLAMALRNLVDNALKFSRDSRPPHIEITATGIGGSVQLAVRDNGVGFEMKFHDRIFSIFQRLHRAEDYPGTGVGLAIVRKAMERMGGRVWAQSQPGQGATFFLELPAAP